MPWRTEEYTSAGQRQSTYVWEGEKQADGGNEIEVTKRIAAEWNSWRKVTGVLCD